jgi:hypothetical protein
MENVRTNHKPRAYNGLLQGEKGVSREWCSAVYPRKAGVIFPARWRHVCRSKMTRLDPFCPVEVTEIIEFIHPPGDLFIRRLQVRILHRPPEKPRGDGERRSPILVSRIFSSRISSQRFCLGGGSGVASLAS